MSESARAHGLGEVGSGGVPPQDRLAQLGHVSQPAQMYAIMKPVSKPVSVPADTNERMRSFTSAMEGDAGWGAVPPADTASLTGGLPRPGEQRGENA
jgi:hypothetical protein